MRQRRAFTLVEVLLTVSIIALLTAIMTPAMHQARAAARRTTCATQLRALVLAGNCYAQEHRGWLPPGPREIYFGGPADPDRGSPLELFCAARVGQADLSSQNGWYGQGLLWQQRALDSGRFFYCPEVEAQGWGYAQAWPQHFDKDPEHAGEKSVVTGAYIYRGGHASAAGTPDGPLNAMRSSGNEPLFTDSPLYGSMWHGTGYVVAYLDGHVQFRPFSTPPVTTVQLAPLWQAVSESPATQP
jgi:prepilin-type N-terminal cleavage/methylation domain-containing protein/prepilin-type processing-associated H-X9-DG protein